MIVDVRRVGEQDWLGHFELRDMQLDFSEVSDPVARLELERTFREHPALTASAIEVARLPAILGTGQDVLMARRGTAVWLATACITVLFRLGFVTRFDTSELEL
jgi:hypothetical protein